MLDKTVLWARAASRHTYLPKDLPGDLDSEHASTFEAPPKLDAAFEDHALYQIKSSVLKAPRLRRKSRSAGDGVDGQPGRVESRQQNSHLQGLEVAKRKKALRRVFLCFDGKKRGNGLHIGAIA